MTAPEGFYDDLETRDPEAREEALLAALPDLIALAQAKIPAYAASLAGIDPAAIDSRQALADLPLVRKAELTGLQAADPPFGGLSGLKLSKSPRVFMSPGPIYEPQGRWVNHWRLARALHAAGFRAGELVHNSFAYHLTPGGWMLDDGAQALGCPVFPAGTGNSEQQVQAIAHLRPAGYTGTPDFLKVLLDKGAESFADLSSLTKALVSGGALFPSLRREYQERGIAVLQCYATADAGLIGYESSAQEGLILDEAILVEIVRPGTGDLLPEGEVGEVLVTILDPDFPLIRFATGDLSAILPGLSPCGRTGVRLKGWMGRADQSTKVKGMFVTAGQVAEALRRHPEIVRARLEVAREGESDAMTLRCELKAGPRDTALAEAIETSLREATKVKGQVVFAEPGSLANDGKVIDDLRDYG